MNNRVQLDLCSCYWRSLKVFIYFQFL